MRADLILSVLHSQMPQGTFLRLRRFSREATNYILFNDEISLFSLFKKFLYLKERAKLIIHYIYLYSKKQKRINILLFNKLKG